MAVPHCRGAQAVVEPDVVPEGKGGRVHFFRLQIGRIRIDYRAGPGVLPKSEAWRSRPRKRRSSTLRPPKVLPVAL